MENDLTPLTKFLIALCHDPDLREEFESEDFDFEAAGLTSDHWELVKRANISEIENAVRAEYRGQGQVYASFWIQLPWIFTAGGGSSDEPTSEPKS